MNVFIVGAGFTKATSPNAPLNRDLLEALADKSSASASPTLRKRYETGDIEIALTRLGLDIALSQSEDPRKLRQRIESELADYFSSFCASEDLMAQSQWLTYLIDSAFLPGDVANQLELRLRSGRSIGLPSQMVSKWGYGFLNNPLVCNDIPSSPVTVLKIHGSANFAIAPYGDKPTASAVNFVFDECFFPRSAQNTHFGYGAGTGRSYLIAPSYVKIPTVEVSYLMLDALTASTKAKNLVIIGSSLRPEDGFLTVLVTNFLRQPSWHDRKIRFVDLAAESIINRLKDYWA